MKQRLLLLCMVCFISLTSNASLQLSESSLPQPEKLEISPVSRSMQHEMTQAEIDDNILLNASQPKDHSFRETIDIQDTLLYWVVAFELLFSMIVFVKLGIDYLRSKQPYLPVIQLP